MKKTKLLIIAFASIFFVSCSNVNNENAIEEQEIIKTLNPENNTENIVSEKLENFAVVWKWLPKEKELVIDKVADIAVEMNQLWEKGVINNTYFDTDISADKYEFYPNLSCFLKAKSKDEAHNILNNLSFVQNGIAGYTLHPVGTLWLGRNTETIEKIGVKKSFVTVWTANETFNPNTNNELIAEQTKAISSLWAEGLIENAYWDMDDTYKGENEKINNIRDFVFFVNANTENEARIICDNLPFVKNNIASYKMVSVGIFWLGEYKK